VASTAAIEATSTPRFTSDKVAANDGKRVNTAYVGLGANLGDREGTLRRALELLDAREGVRVEAVSTLRETDPVGFLDQPRFLNGAARLGTELAPHDLLRALLAVERELGRERTGPRFGPRTVDLDLLLYGDLELDEPGLALPHPRLHERRFALEPLAELDAALVVPGRGSVAALLAELD
jgi:2-amino-4-hydroxy-6-hydroxymethyldihydropteridine diphosphokinase